MPNNHRVTNTHNAVELTGNIFVHHPAVAAYKVEAEGREQKRIDEFLRALEPSWATDPYGVMVA